MTSELDLIPYTMAISAGQMKVKLMFLNTALVNIQLVIMGTVYLLYLNLR